MTSSFNSFNYRPARALALSCLGTTALSALLMAGVPDRAAAQEAEPSFGLEEIVVTARRRAESLQTVPVAVAAYNADELEMRSALSLSDLGSVAPNLYVSSGPSASPSAASFYIRGIGQTDFIPTTDPGVGVYVDGVYIARQTGNMLDLVEPERVEVLRGPQGTLFGRNTIGGAINITSKRPTGELTGKIEVTGGNYDRIDAKGHIEFPLVKDKLAAAITVATRNQDGYGERLLTGEDMGDRDMLSGRAVINWTASENVSVLLTADGTTRDEHAMPHRAIDLVETDPDFQALRAYDAFVLSPPPPFGFGTPYITPSATCPAFPAPATNCTSPYVQASGTYDSAGTGPNLAELDVWGVSATVDWKLGDVSLKSITAYREQEDSIGVDYDASPLPVSEQSETFDTNFFSQELQLFGTVNERIEWLVGAYYSREKTDIGFNADFLQPFFGPSIRLDNSLTTKSYALFGSVSAGLTEDLTVTGGLRYSKDKKNFTDSANFLSNPFLMGAPSSFYATGALGPIPDFLPFGTVVEVDDSWDNVSPKVSVEYEATDNAFLYSSVSWGYKSGSYNGRALIGSTAPSAYDPEKVTSYEVGAKLDFADNRVRLNLAAFQTDYKDIQTTVLISEGVLVNTPTVNAGKARIRGFEAELTAVPVEGLRFDGSLGYVDAEYRRLNAPDSFPNAAIPFGTDAKFAQTPEWTASFGMQYGFAIGNYGRLTLRGDVNHRSKIFPNVPNVEEVADGSLTLLNARVTYNSPDELWQVAVFGTNLTDEEYKTFGFVAFGIASGYYGRPREYGATLTRRF